MSKPLAEPAKRARELALERHRKEVRGIVLQRNMLAACFIAMTAIACWAGFRIEALEATSDAPPLQRVTVVTEGFKDKKGTWRSFDNGEPITVTDWHQR